LLEKMKRYWILFLWHMNNSFSTAIWYFIKFVLFMFSQGSYLVVFGTTHLPTGTQHVNTSKRCAWAKGSFCLPFQKEDPVESEAASQRTKPPSSHCQGPTVQMVPGCIWQRTDYLWHSEATHRKPNLGKWTPHGCKLKETHSRKMSETAGRQGWEGQAERWRSLVEC
jgi:hypothetical protein